MPPARHPEHREPFVRGVIERVQVPLGYVRLNVSAVRAGSGELSAAAGLRRRSPGA